MGNYKFRLSEMIPNAWFYKLREIGRGRKQSTTTSKKIKQTSSPKLNQPHQYNPRKSYYITRELHPNNNTPEVEPPRKSSKHKTRRRTLAATSGNEGKSSSSSVSAGCSCRTTLNQVWSKEEQNSSSPLGIFSSESESKPDPEFRTDTVLIPTDSFSFDEMVSSCAYNSNTTVTTTTTDVIVIDVDNNSLPRKDDKLQSYDAFSELQLPPIITKPHSQSQSQPQPQFKTTKLPDPKIERSHQNIKRKGVSSPGVKLRVNSPRIASLKVQSQGRKSVSKMASSGSRKSVPDSLAIVKSSFNPQKDFRESMVEMIVENNIRASKDLENLLACYLSLNSEQYHDLIIKVFKQIWFDLTQTS